MGLRSAVQEGTEYFLSHMTGLHWKEEFTGGRNNSEGWEMGKVFSQQRAERTQGSHSPWYYKEEEPLGLSPKHSFFVRTYRDAAHSPWGLKPLLPMPAQARQHQLRKSLSLVPKWVWLRAWRPPPTLCPSREGPLSLLVPIHPPASPPQRALQPPAMAMNHRHPRPLANKQLCIRQIRMSFCLCSRPFC